MSDKLTKLYPLDDLLLLGFTYTCMQYCIFPRIFFFLCVGMDSGNYQSHFAPMNITAEEQAGLEAVLRLTTTVAEKVYSTLRTLLCTTLRSRPWLNSYS